MINLIYTYTVFVTVCDDRNCVYFVSAVLINLSSRSSYYFHVKYSCFDMFHLLEIVEPSLHSRELLLNRQTTKLLIFVFFCSFSEQMAWENTLPREYYSTFRLHSIYLSFPSPVPPRLTSRYSSFSNWRGNWLQQTLGWGKQFSFTELILINSYFV